MFLKNFFRGSQSVEKGAEMQADEHELEFSENSNLLEQENLVSDSPSLVKNPEPSNLINSKTPLSIEEAQLEGRVIEAISTVFDPEIPVNIYELGLIYNIGLSKPGNIRVEMTLTSPSCPVAGTLPGDVQRVVESVDGAANVEVDLVWDPPWTPDKMTEAAKLELGFM